MSSEQEDRLFVLVQGVAGKVSEIHQKVAAMEPTVARLDKAVNGNGSPGLLASHAEVKTIQENCTARQAHEAGNVAARVGNMIAIGALVVAALAVALQFLL